MKQTIHELGSLCKIAAGLERKWDQAGKAYLQTEITSVEYMDLVEEYLKSVRRLEAALTTHLVAVTTEIVRARAAQKAKHAELTVVQSEGKDTP